MQLKPAFSIVTLFLLGCTTLPNPSMQAKGYIKKLNLEYVFYFENKYSKENTEKCNTLLLREGFEKYEGKIVTILYNSVSFGDNNDVSVVYINKWKGRFFNNVCESNDIFVVKRIWDK